MSSPAPLRLTGVLETSLYVDDVERSVGFYRRLFGLEPMIRDDRLCALAVPGPAALLLFRKGSSIEPVDLPGGRLPGHDGSGEYHVAFSIARDDLADWETRLAELGIVVESRVNWERGGVSLYFRDPDRNLLELVTPGCWPNY